MSKARSRGENEAQRAEILRLLVPFYPEPMTCDGLIQSLMINQKPVDDEDELNFHLAYLEESGYVKLTRIARRGKTKITHAAATRKGVDLLDGRIPEDPGIAL